MIREVRDHWYWRPNWRPGRSFYTWHVIFPNDPVLTDMHAAYGRLVGSLPGITPVPVQWLHLTLQGIGFADKVPQSDLDPIIEAAQRRLEYFLTTKPQEGELVLLGEQLGRITELARVGLRDADAAGALLAAAERLLLDTAQSFAGGAA